MKQRAASAPVGRGQLVAEALTEQPWAAAYLLSQAAKVFRELADTPTGDGPDGGREARYGSEAAICGRLVAGAVRKRLLTKAAPWMDALVEGMAKGEDAYARLFADLVADARLEAPYVSDDNGNAGGDGWRARCIRAAGVCEELALMVGKATREMGWVPYTARSGIPLPDVLTTVGVVATGCDAARAGAAVSPDLRKLADGAAFELLKLIEPLTVEERPLGVGGVQMRSSERHRTHPGLAQVVLMKSLHEALRAVAGGRVTAETGGVLRGLLAQLAADADKDAIAAGVPRPEHGQAVPTAKERPEPGLQELVHTLSDQERQAYDFIKSKFPDPVPCKKLADALGVEVSAITNRIARNLKRRGLVRLVRAGGYTLTTNP